MSQPETDQFDLTYQVLESFNKPPFTST